MQTYFPGIKSVDAMVNSTPIELLQWNMDLAFQNNFTINFEMNNEYNHLSHLERMGCIQTFMQKSGDLLFNTLVQSVRPSQVLWPTAWRSLKVVFLPKPGRKT